MKRFVIVGGVYREFCIQPSWNLVYGSGGRAAHCISGLINEPIELHAYIGGDIVKRAKDLAENSNAIFKPHHADKSIGFDYFHPLSTPRIDPPVDQIKKLPSIKVSGDVVLRYGMLEGDAIVDAKVAVFDPQSAYGTKKFQENGSRADKLAVVMNMTEAQSMLGTQDPNEISKAIIATKEADVVVLKRGPKGALVIAGDRFASIPAYETKNVWKLGSGDVFSSTFAALWGYHDYDPFKAADLASRATAYYCDTRALPTLSPDDLLAEDRSPLKTTKGRIYLAGPFFDIGQRWLIEEAKEIFGEMGATVFSPVHEVGPGTAMDVAPKDIEGLEKSDLVYAILNGMDPGTIFEIGYAVKAGKPVIALAQNVGAEDLKMIEGTGCEVVTDFTTSIYRALWNLPATEGL